VRPRIRNPEAVADARKLVGAGADIELVLLFFRDRGFDIADCIFALEELFPNNLTRPGVWLPAVKLGLTDTSPVANSEKPYASAETTGSLEFTGLAPHPS
jgi:hypothetical protein